MWVVLVFVLQNIPLNGRVTSDARGLHISEPQNNNRSEQELSNLFFVVMWSLFDVCRNELSLLERVIDAFRLGGRSHRSVDVEGVSCGVKYDRNFSISVEL